ncbi:MAG: phospho-N-acetylmuramoyl-pentapeptide-transferase [Clostridia bacterium]|nr:phospho-N-acetylmuramoyl-pentapeptide-transferase [Clostridia bacterium]
MSGIIAAAAAIAAFIVTVIAGKWAIPFLHKLKYGQTILDIGPSWHKKKQGTPTMGGIMFIIGIVGAILIAVPVYYTLTSANSGIWGENLLQKVRLFGGLIMALCFGAIGFWDDYIKVVKKRNLGLTAKQKMGLMLLVSCLYLASLYLAGERGTTQIPFIGTVNLGFGYWLIALFVILGTVNSVNLTDGIDGLAGSVTMLASMFFMLIATLLHFYGFSIFAAAVAGGCAGFLVYNFHPARVFMGDTGSLFLGGMVVAMGFGLGYPILILPIGFIYFMEAMSDIIQIGYFKLTRRLTGEGKRVFKMAPIHHHFEMCGWNEVKVVIVFSLITIIGGSIAVLSVLLG